MRIEHAIVAATPKKSSSRRSDGFSGRSRCADLMHFCKKYFKRYTSINSVDSICDDRELSICGLIVVLLLPGERSPAECSVTCSLGTETLSRSVALGNSQERHRRMCYNVELGCPSKGFPVPLSFEFCLPQYR